MSAPNSKAGPFGRSILRALILRTDDLPLLMAYAAGFALLHQAAAPWSGTGFFSLWYPAAGLRFAVLWQSGCRLTPWLMLAELITDWLTGTVPMAGPDALPSAMGALRPGLTYGLAVALVRRLRHEKHGLLSLAPMPFGVAALAAPTLNAIAVVPFEAAFIGYSTAYRDGIDVAVALTGLAVGDLLGILVLAPPLLWLVGILNGSIPRRIPIPRLRSLLENALILGACLLLTASLWRAGLGAQPLPTLLAGAWIGLRHGRTAGWFAIIAAVLVFLPYSVTLDDVPRLQFHFELAAVVLLTWLAGSFADAQLAASALLEKRNRLLFQAERLKTLRAMSVAVIHEISQPLSTLVIEARHLRERTAEFDPDIAASAELVHRKAGTLSEMVRRLRRFGGRDVDEPSPVPVLMLVDTARQIVSPELRVQGGNLEIGTVPADVLVLAQEIELTQALVNLLRNAVAASAGATVRLTVDRAGEEVRIIVTNPAQITCESGGMGVGLLIARTIVEAHGGNLVRDDEPGIARFIISLPLAGAVS